MPRTEEKWLIWFCRALIIVDMLLVLSGYLSGFQVTGQLITPLVPGSTISQIISDSYVFEASIAAAIFMTGGLICMSFGKNKAALVLFLSAIVAQQLLIRLMGH